MDELTLDNKKYLSSKRAAKVTGYAKDYVGQLCREGRVNARLVGRNWYVLESSILEHRFGAENTEENGANEQVSASVSMPVTWTEPQYAPEVATPITESLKKPESAPIAVVEAAPDTQKVLADMQSAWKEWFDRQERTLPEPVTAHEDLLPAPIEEMESAPVAASVEEALAQEVEEAVPVHIQRVELPHLPYQQEFEPEPQQPSVQIHRVAPMHRTAPQPRIVHQAAPSRRRRASGVLATRAWLIAVAGIAVAVTIIGSGLMDDYLKWDRTLLPVTNFFGGVQQISK